MPENNSDWVMLDLNCLKTIDEKLGMLMHNLTICNNYWTEELKKANEKLDKLLEKH